MEAGKPKFEAELPLDLIEVEEKPLRTLMTDDGMEELRASIREHGVLVPISVVNAGEVFHLVAGLRRVIACRSLGMASIPALVGEMSESERMWARFAENRIREDVSPLDEGLYVVEWLNRGGVTQAEVAAALGVSESWVSQRVGILRWPPEVQDSLGRRGISFGVARELAGIADDGRRRHYLRFAEMGGCSVRQAAQWRQQAARAAALAGQMGGAEAEPERGGGEAGGEEACFICERAIGLAGGRYLMVCEPCLDRIDSQVRERGRGKNVPPGGT